MNINVVNITPEFPCQVLQTGQTTVYAIGDNGDIQTGIAKSYTILTTGPQSGVSTIKLPAYAAATISFDAASKEIRDSANGMAQFKTGDTIVIQGSTGNNAVLTVATGNVAAKAVVTEAIADEAAGAYVTISKRGTLSNNLVVDRNTGLIWGRYTSYSMTGKLGAGSDGLFYWTGTSCTLHPAAADLQMIGGTKGVATIKIIGGAGEAARYNVGHSIICTGFANAVNLFGPCRVVSVTVNGADLDIVILSGNQTFVSEAAGGSRTISVACNGVFGFKDAANVAALGGYADWRVPNIFERFGLTNAEASAPSINTTAFPEYPGSSWTIESFTSNTQKMVTTSAWVHQHQSGIASCASKTGTRYVMLVRGGRIS